jgi:hypothetical protein
MGQAVTLSISLGQDLCKAKNYLPKKQMWQVESLPSVYWHLLKRKFRSQT